MQDVIGDQFDRELSGNPDAVSIEPHIGEIFRAYASRLGPVGWAELRVPIVG